MLFCGLLSQVQIEFPLSLVSELRFEGISERSLLPTVVQFYSLRVSKSLSHSR